MSDIDFHDMTAEVPEFEDAERKHAALDAAFDAATDAEGRLAAITGWNDLRIDHDTWHSLTGLRFQQDTRNEEYKKAREHRDELQPKLRELDLARMRRLVGSPHRGELEASLGKHLFSLWECEITTYDPAIEQETVEEAKLQANYTELVASAKLEFMGETLTLPELGKFSEDPRREVRKGAQETRWAWFRANSDDLDRIYDKLVHLRHDMATRLGFADFVELGYRRMSRTDYDRTDVERFRGEVSRHVVPLGEELRRRQQELLGVDRLMFWDEAVHDPRGNPKPLGDHDWLLERAREMYRGMGSGLGEFFELMVDRHLLDLKSREGKAAGGFCTSLEKYRVPFIFANFNGTRGDVEVLTHEMGHAFQGYSSRDLFPMDLLWPTAEACEIHSMSLEFLTWPLMDHFFGEQEADRFRRMHLTEALLFLPYGVAVDHFQHLVYENPDATPADRKGMWREMERAYLPWTDYGDLAYPLAGGRWQAQMHLYNCPFYYVDYALAQICALQYWARSNKDPAEALASYVQLCRRGGAAPFQTLAEGAGLTSPFKEGCLTEAVDQARAYLGA